ncbi:hypothetical protein [Brevibacterium aurantiacum]|uniref:Uncharacterized protein n=1 Tax=Brevibacterium aurantiacum TaxID=273384 RepID=A0A2A3X195_BREAU|nr:hypothetical protein [Brevibacterium aurantiacum]PCC17555.1 hypothetical protein CIK79_04195 [Brevibacterium aurantiacum]PCC45201.1 hypothetical protein CIK64_16680 [Brevibacterium aurantiacum]PCC51270.1 hypothetical protein CIK62_01765 [Brevibacterium aurantiacum]SMX75516.1 hypothetical protein BAURA86_00626 [Brevibacterium aurantiacum]
MLFSYLREAAQSLRMWSTRRILVAIAAAGASTIIIGLSTVLIPNSFFSRDIPPVWWDYPVWILMSVLLGVLVATYVREPGARVTSSERRGGTFGTVGGMLGWFAVGCPVCNKIALVVLGYTGALTYFAPLQPVLAVLSVVLLLVAVVVRLKGQFSCPVPTRERSAQA